MNTRKIIIFIASIFFLLHVHSLYAKDLDRVKENIKQSYLHIVNEDPELLKKIDEINHLSGNPDLMIRELSEGYNPELVKRYLSTIKEDGSWGDINYDDDSRSGWQPSYHVERMMWMAKAYKDSNSEYYHNTELGEAIHKTLAYWYKGNFVCRNWWYNQIGCPRMLGPVLLLMEDELSGEEKALGIKYMENAKFGMTGQNSAWLAENVLIRSLLEQDEKLFLQARETILKELKIAYKGEGIRPDMSFHQHGAQQQFGNYGLAYANTMAYWGRIFAGTEYTLDEEQLSVLRGYILDGIRWTIWKRNMDISACGRQLFKYGQEGKALSVGKAIKNMMVADPEYSEEYQKFYDIHIKVNGEENKLLGNRYFNYSDYGIHRTKDWMASVKMSSNRVIGSEVVNAENLLGHYLGDGALFVYVDGDEYRDIFPVWDWTKIPGTTSYQSEEVMKENSSEHYFKNNHDFVGGVTDGKDAVQAMVLNKNDLQARQSYFFIQDNIVCLGSDIKGSKNYPITTSVTQNLFEGKTEKFEIQGKGIAYHQGDVAYWFPGEQNIKTSNSRSEGNWKRVANFYGNERIVRDVFTIWIEHGVNPEDVAYCYTIIPAVSENNYKEKVNQQTINILSCSEEVHAIEDKDIAQAVFFAPSSIRFSDKTSLSVDKGCIVMMKKEGKSRKLFITEPTQKENILEVHISGRWVSEYGEYDKATKQTVLKIPVENQEGKTIQIELSQR